MLIGNGVNLAAECNWMLNNDGLCERFPRSEGESCDQEDRAEARPNNCFFSLCRDLAPTFVHHALAALKSHFSVIMTTNYDPAMNRAMGVSKNSDRVWHLHETADYPDMCVYTKQEYNDVAELMKQEIPEPGEPLCWSDWLRAGEVHICGHSLKATEKLLYQAFKRRKELIDKGEHFKRRLEQNRIYAWLFCDEKVGEVQSIAERLESLRVTPILIKVPTDGNNSKDYVAAWEQLLGRLILRLNNVHIHRGLSGRFKGGKSRNCLTRDLNVTAAFEESLKCPDRCWVSLPMQKLVKLQGLKKSLPWLFLCELGEHVSLWKIDPSVLTARESKDSTLDFYLDYITGDLYERADEPSKLRQFASCTRLEDISEFDSLVVDLSRPEEQISCRECPKITQLQRNQSEEGNTAPLYRITNIEYVIKSLEAKRFVFRRKDTWEDQWEFLSDKVCSEDPVSGDNVQSPQYGKEIYGISWTEQKEECAAMWQLYSADKMGVRIKVNREKLKKLMEIIQNYVLGITTNEEECREKRQGEKMPPIVEEVCKITDREVSSWNEELNETKGFHTYDELVNDCFPFGIYAIKYVDRETLLRYAKRLGNEYPCGECNKKFHFLKLDAYSFEKETRSIVYCEEKKQTDTDLFTDNGKSLIVKFEQESFQPKDFYEEITFDSRVSVNIFDRYRKLLIDLGVEPSRIKLSKVFSTPPTILHSPEKDESQNSADQ